MEIKGYRVKWAEYGWSYGVPIVRKRVKLFGVIPYWKKVWQGEAINCLTAEKMLPDRMKKWFEEAVDEYENYTRAWAKI